MNNRWLAGAALAACLLACVPVARAADDVPLFRLFLKDGGTLVSYGEYARVGERVVFSMPTDASANPPLQLVNIAADRVDWGRTERYNESTRGARYIATRAEDDYTQLTDEVARTLNDVATAGDVSKRLAIVENARNTLAKWPSSHFNYRQNDVRQMLMLLDEAIADLRTAAGGQKFDLSLVAYSDPAPIIVEQPLPRPTPQEAIEQTLSAARLVDSASERTSLLTAAVAAIDRSRGTLPADWANGTRAAAAMEIESEIAADRAYQALTDQSMKDATMRAKLGDVRGVERVVAVVRRRDEALGYRRPEAVGALIAAVESQLDAARRLRLARDKWELRAADLRKYRESMRTPLDRFAMIRPHLDNIKSLAGSSAAALATVRQTCAELLQAVRAITPPDEMRTVHSLLITAAVMANNAATIRREATISGSIARAWDASSAAAGAMMFAEQARNGMLEGLRRPELP